MLRLAKPHDYDALGHVMYDAIRNGRSPYTQAQRQAWLPRPNHGSAWHTRLAAQRVILAADATGPLGFLSLTRDGYIDLAFIRPHAQHTGLFRKLCTAAEAEAAALALTALTTHASLMAEPAFAAQGFTAVRHESVTLSGVPLQRAEMRRTLPPL